MDMSRWELWSAMTFRTEFDGVHPFFRTSGGESTLPHGPLTDGARTSMKSWLRTTIVVLSVAVSTAFVVMAVILLNPPASGGSDATGPRGVGPLTIGNPTLAVCPTSGTGIGGDCEARDYVYTVTIESSTITFGAAYFRIDSSNGAVYATFSGEPGYSLLNAGGLPVAHWYSPNGSMGIYPGWTYTPGVSAATSLTNLFSVRIDMGSADPAGHGVTFEGLRAGARGSTSPLALP